MTTIQSHPQCTVSLKAAGRLDNVLACYWKEALERSAGKRSAGTNRTLSDGARKSADDRRRSIGSVNCSSLIVNRYGGKHWRAKWILECGHYQSFSKFKSLQKCSDVYKFFESFKSLNSRWTSVWHERHEMLAIREFRDVRKASKLDAVLN